MAEETRGKMRMGLVLDCVEPEALASFWGEALHYTLAGAVENYVMLVPADEPGPKLLLQKVPEGKNGKNRMHLDIETADVDVEVARLEQLGATRLVSAPILEHGTRWVVLADPEGNEFCVCSGGVE